MSILCSKAKDWEDMYAEDVYDEEEDDFVNDEDFAEFDMPVSPKYEELEDDFDGEIYADEDFDFPEEDALTEDE